MNNSNIGTHQAQGLNISILTVQGHSYFRSEDIIRMEAVSNYTYIYFDQHKPILVAKVLKVYQALLEPFGFIRTHRSHLINSLHIASIKPKGEVVMKDDSTAAVSRRKRKEVIRHLHQSYVVA